MRSGSLEKVKSLLREGFHLQAKKELLSSLFEAESLSAWRSCSKNKKRGLNLFFFVKSVSFSHECPTAQIDLKTGSLEIGIDFFLEKVNSWTDLFFVLLHERGHVLISRSFGSEMFSFKSASFGNLWEDIYINYLVLRFISTDFVERFYKDAEGRFDLLIQQDARAWYKKNRDWLSFHASSFPLVLEILAEGKLHNIAYPTWMRFGLLMEEADSKGEDYDSYLTIGTHGHEDGNTGPISDLESKILSSFEPEELPLGTEIMIPSFEECLDKFLRSPDIDTILVDYYSEDEPMQDRSLFMESIGSSEAMYLSSGSIPLFWSVDVFPAPQEPMKMYIDVSGSMKEYWSLARPLSLAFDKYCDEFFQFSTEVVKVSPEDNRIHSTNGTSYDSVASHILDNKFRRVVVVTDNTDSISKNLHSLLKSNLDFLYLVFTSSPSQHFPHGFDSIATISTNFFEP